MTPNYAPLWYWVREREEIRKRKALGLDPRRWTRDEILRTYRFCNVRREDDIGTIWIRKHIREPFADHRYLWLMLCIARQINWPETLAELIAENAWPTDDTFQPRHITAVLDARKSRGDKIWTGAYMISAPSEKGASKNAYIAEEVIGGLWDRRKEFASWWLVMLRSTHRKIMQTSGWGQFMAYQAVVDMRFTKLLEDALDVNIWAAAGPGTIRGLNRLHGRAVTAPLSQEQALREMRAIYDVVTNNTGVHMDFSDVPNILCETDKYLRVKNGEGAPRALYVPGRGS